MCSSRFARLSFVTGSRIRANLTAAWSRLRGCVESGWSGSALDSRAPSLDAVTPCLVGLHHFAPGRTLQHWSGGTKARSIPWLLGNSCSVSPREGFVCFGSGYFYKKLFALTKNGTLAMGAHHQINLIKLRTRSTFRLTALACVHLRCQGQSVVRSEMEPCVDLWGSPGPGSQPVRIPPVVGLRE